MNTRRTKMHSPLAVLLIGAATVPGAWAEGVLDGSLPRSAAQSFRTVREAPGSALVRVERLATDSSAAQAGLRNGDVILKIDGQEYASPAKAYRLLEHGKGGKQTSLEVRREGVTRSIRYVSPVAPLEQIPGVTSVYASIEGAGKLRMRTITTRPQNASGPLPGIYFVQWVSCDSIEYPLNLEDHGWQRMLQLLAETSGAMFMRTDKAGIGDSEGDCGELDYDTELANHRIAYAKFKANPQVDPERIVIYGASTGGNMASLLAAETKPAGLAIWGTAIKTWFEHLVEYNRRHLELSGRDPVESTAIINRQIEYLTEFLIRGQSPERIRMSEPKLGEVWNELLGTSGELYYGRPYRYHQQAQAKNWIAAVAHLRKPTLVLYGEYDWYEAEDDHALIARAANRVQPGNATYVIVPRTDHHFSIYPSLQAAYQRRNGLVSPQRPVQEITTWFHRVVDPEVRR